MKWQKTIDTDIPPPGSPLGLYEAGRLVGAVVRRGAIWIADVRGLILGDYPSKRMAMAAVETAVRL